MTDSENCWVSDEEGITAEWLFGSPGRKEVKYFTREGYTLDLSKTHLKAARKLLAALETKEALVGSRSLLLSRLGLLKNSEVVQVYDAIRNVRIVNRTFEGEPSKSTVDVLSDPNQQTRVADFLRQIGIEIGELFVMNTIYDPSLKRPIHLRQLASDHQGSKPVLYVRPPASAKEQSISFRADMHLSRGTLKMLRLANTLLATLDSGDLLVIDEFESQLHTNISRTILQLFHDPETNPHNAQLVVATHDTNLLDPKLLRRDQISFVEKDEAGASRVYALSDIRGVRNDASYEKDYLIGKYGGVPEILGL